MNFIYKIFFCFLTLVSSDLIHASETKEEKKNIAFMTQKLAEIQKKLVKGHYDEVEQKLHLNSAFDEYEKTFDYLNKNTLEFKSLKYQSFLILSKLKLDKKKLTKPVCFSALDTPFDALNMFNKYAKINKYCVIDINYANNQVTIHYSYNGAYFGTHLMHNQLKISYDPNSKTSFLTYSDITDEINDLLEEKSTATN